MHTDYARQKIMQSNHPEPGGAWAALSFGLRWQAQDSGPERDTALDFASEREFNNNLG